MWITIKIILTCHGFQEIAQLSSLVVVSLKVCISLIPSHLTTKILIPL